MSRKPRRTGWFFFITFALLCLVGALLMPSLTQKRAFKKEFGFLPGAIRQDGNLILMQMKLSARCETFLVLFRQGLHLRQDIASDELSPTPETELQLESSTKETQIAWERYQRSLKLAKSIGLSDIFNPCGELTE